jgi:hypothetical protein
LNAEQGPVSKVGDDFAPNGGYARFSDSYIAITYVTPVDTNGKEHGKSVELTPNGVNEISVSAEKATVSFRVLPLPGSLTLSNYFRMTIYDGEKIVDDEIFGLVNGEYNAGVFEVEL